MSNIKFSVGIIAVIFITLIFLFLHELYVGTNSWKLQIGTSLFIMGQFLVTIVTIIPSLFGLGKLRSPKVISFADGLTCRMVDSPVSIGAGKVKATFQADKTIVPKHMQKEFRGFKGLIMLIGQYCEFEVTFRLNDLVPYKINHTTTPEYLYRYIGTVGFTGKGKIVNDYKHKYEEMQQNLLNLSDSLETNRAQLEMLVKSKNSELQTAGKVVNSLIKDVADATSGLTQLHIPQDNK